MGNNNKNVDWKDQLKNLGKQLKEEMTPEEQEQAQAFMWNGEEAALTHAFMAKNKNMLSCGVEKNWFN